MINAEEIRYMTDNELAEQIVKCGNNIPEASEQIRVLRAEQDRRYDENCEAYSDDIAAGVRPDPWDYCHKYSN